jgi:hypothetical protein
MHIPGTFNFQDIVKSGPIVLRPSVATIKLLESHCDQMIEIAKRINRNEKYRIHFTEWLQLFERRDLACIESIE